MRVQPSAFITRCMLAWLDSTSVAQRAEVELGEVDVGPKLFGVSLLDVLEPRE